MRTPWNWAAHFGAAWHNRLLRAKGQKLEDCWARLRRSKAPLAFKLKALPMVCWNKALHGSEAWARLERWVPFLRDLRGFLLAVGDQRQQHQAGDAAQVIDDTHWDEIAQQSTPSTCLPEDWHDGMFQLFKPATVAEHAQWLVTALRPLQDELADHLPVSFIELTLFLFEREDFVIPHRREGQDILVRPRQLFNRPTLARMVHGVRSIVSKICEFFDLVFFLVKGPRLESSIALPSECRILRPPIAARSQLRELTLHFSGGRGIRKTTDLARPPVSDRR